LDLLFQSITELIWQRTWGWVDGTKAVAGLLCKRLLPNLQSLYLSTDDIFINSADCLLELINLSAKHEHGIEHLRSIHWKVPVYIYRPDMPLRTRVQQLSSEALELFNIYHSKELMKKLENYYKPPITELHCLLIGDFGMTSGLGLPLPVAVMMLDGLKSVKVERLLIYSGNSPRLDFTPHMEQITSLISTLPTLRFVALLTESLSPGNIKDIFSNCNHLEVFSFSRGIHQSDPTMPRIHPYIKFHLSQCLQTWSRDFDEIDHLFSSSIPDPVDNALHSLKFTSAM